MLTPAMESVKTASIPLARRFYYGPWAVCLFTYPYFSDYAAQL